MTSEKWRQLLHRVTEEKLSTKARNYKPKGTRLTGSRDNAGFRNGRKKVEGEEKRRRLPEETRDPLVGIEPTQAAYQSRALTATPWSLLWLV